MPCIAWGMQADTSRFTEHLKTYRGHETYELSPADYASTQNEFVSWTESRLRGGRSVRQMNAELKAAGLLSDGQQAVDDYDRTYAGFLGGISIRPIRSDLLAVTLGIYTGAFCNFDDTGAALSPRVFDTGRSALRGKIILARV